jgi:hypothetical protein
MSKSSRDTISNYILKATEQHVAEAIRLFNISTYEAATAGVAGKNFVIGFIAYSIIFFAQ